MTKRSFLLVAAFGLVASLAFATPSQAATIYVVKSQIVVTAGTATGAVENFTGAVSAPLTILSSTSAALSPVTGTPGSPSADQITFSFTGVGPGTYELDFTVMGPDGGLGGLGGTVSPPGGAQGGAVILSVTSAVPEPSSMALLGLGMTSFLAFRRFLKRTPKI